MFTHTRVAPTLPALSRARHHLHTHTLCFPLVIPNRLQALRTKTFLDFANSAPGRTQQALRTRRLLATWVARIRGEEAQAGCGNTGFLTLPG